MIYTVGHRDTYEAAFERPPLMKMGRRDDWNGKPYHGGAVWRYRVDAERYLRTRNLGSYNVYGVRADWQRDTERRAGEPHRRLVRDAPLIRLNRRLP